MDSFSSSASSGNSFPEDPLSIAFGPGFSTPLSGSLSSCSSFSRYLEWLQTPLHSDFSKGISCDALLSELKPLLETGDSAARFSQDSAISLQASKRLRLNATSQNPPHASEISVLADNFRLANFFRDGDIRLRSVSPKCPSPTAERPIPFSRHELSDFMHLAKLVCLGHCLDSVSPGVRIAPTIFESICQTFLTRDSCPRSVWAGKLDEFLWNIQMAFQEVLTAQLFTNGFAGVLVPSYMTHLVCAIQSLMEDFGSEQMSQAKESISAALRTDCLSDLAYTKSQISSGDYGHFGKFAPALRNSRCLVSLLLGPSLAHHHKGDPDSPVVRQSSRSTICQADGFCYLRLVGRRNRRFFAATFGPHVKGKLVKLMSFATAGATAASRFPNVTLDPFGSSSEIQAHYMSTDKLLLPDLAVHPFSRNDLDHWVGSAFRKNNTVSDRLGPGFAQLSSTIHNSGLNNDYVPHLQGALTETLDVCPYAMSVELQAKLSTLGAPVNPLAALAHPHPAHKNLEQFMLRVKLRSHIISPTTVMFMKRGKFNDLQQRLPLVTNLENVKIDGKDISRYPLATTAWPRSIKTKTVFMHDAAHYLSPGFVASFFERYHDVDHVLMTGIFPVEVAFDRPSFHPNLYEIRKMDDDKFAYILEGCSDDYYVHDRRSLEWLSLSGIRSSHSNTVFSVTILERAAAHTLIRVSREVPSVPEKWRLFDSPDEVEIPTLGGRDLNHHFKTVPRDVFREVLMHSLSLTTKKRESTLAKARTYSSSKSYQHYDADTWVAIADAVYAIATSEASGVKASFKDSSIRRVKETFLSVVQPKLRFLLPALDFASIVSASVACWRLARFLALITSPIGGLPALAVAALASVTIILTLGAFTPLVREFGSEYLSKVSSFITAVEMPLAVAGLVCLGLATPTLSFWLAKVGLKLGIVNAVIDPLLACTFFRGLSGLIGYQAPGIELQLLLNSINHREDIKVRCRIATTFRSADLMSGGFSVGTSSHPDSDTNPDDPGKWLGLYKRLSPVKRYSVDWDVQSLPESFLSEADIMSDLASTACYDPDAPTHVSVAEWPLEQSLAVLPEAKRSEHSGESGLANIYEIFNLNESDVLELPGQFCSSEWPGYEPSYPKNDCLLVAFSTITKVSVNVLWNVLSRKLGKELTDSTEVREIGLTTECLVALCYEYRIKVECRGEIPDGHPRVVGFSNPDQSKIPFDTIRIYYRPGHWYAEDQRSKPGRYSAPKRAQPGPRGVLNLPKYARQALAFRDAHNSSGCENFFEYKTTPSRAKPYTSDLKNGFTGTLRSWEGKQLDKGFTQSLDATLDNCKPRTVFISVRLGDIGCAKSSPIQQYVKSLSDSNALSGLSVCIAVPRTEQRKDWLAVTNLDDKNKWRVSTFEVALTHTCQLLIIDEVSQIPPGYVDTYLAMNPSCSAVILVGDVCQGNFHEPHPEAKIRALEPECLYFKNFATRYLDYSFTVPRAVAKMFGINTFSKEEGFVRTVRTIDTVHGNPVLCASDAEVRLYSDLGCEAYTFSGAQGKRFDYVQISLGSAAATVVNPGLIRSAFGRARIGVYVILGPNVSTQRTASVNPATAPIFDPTRSAAFLELLTELRRGLRMDRKTSATGGSPLPDRGSDALQVLLHDNQEDLPVSKSWPADPSSGPDTHMPPENPERIFENWGTLPIREDREVFVQNTQSKQFDDANVFSGRAGYRGIEQMFPRQTTTDKVTFLTAVKKRLRFANRTDNVADYIGKKFLGPVLLDAWLHISGMRDMSPPPFDPLLYAQCIYENEFVKLTSKSQSTLLNNADRADPDWRHTFVRIFCKGQLKAKMEAIMSPFKAGQTLASFQDSVILITGPMTRYLVHMHNSHRREGLYYHAGRSPVQMASWCQANWKDEPLHTTNDYTAFDLSQRGEALAFEIQQLRWFSIPDDVVEYYYAIKVDMTCQFGPLATLRHTGEGPTWKFNTDFNAAVLWLQYNLSPNAPVAVSGDDSAICGSPSVRDSWPNIQRYLTLVPKTIRSPQAEFCSWFLTPHGCIKNPTITFLKLQIAKDRGTLPEVRESYASEIALGYHMGDNAFPYLSDLDRGSQALLVREFVTTLPKRFSMLFTRQSLFDSFMQLGKDAATEASARFEQSLWMLNSSALQLYLSWTRRNLNTHVPQYFSS